MRMVDELAMHGWLLGHMRPLGGGMYKVDGDPMGVFDTQLVTDSGDFMFLPLGRDGRRIQVGDLVYGGDGRAWHVCAISDNEYQVWAYEPGLGKEHVQQLKGFWLTHKKPADTVAGIAGEMVRWASECDGADSKHIVQWSTRIMAAVVRDEGEKKDA